MSAGSRRRVRPPAAPASRAAQAEPDGAAAPREAPSPAPAAGRLKQCPFCLEQIPEIALECPACRRRIAGAGSPADFRRRLLVQELVLRQALRERRLGAVRGGLLTRFRKRTLTTSGAAGAGLAAWLAVRAMPEPSAPVGLVFFGWIAALVVLVCFLTDDLRWLAVRRRRRPGDALTAFVRAMQIGRYEDAYACVLPGDRNDRPRLRRAVQALNLGGGRSTFADPDGFRAYWHPLFSVPDSSVRLSGPRVVREQGDFAVVAAEFSATRRAGGWGGGLIGAAVRSAMARENELGLRKLVRRVDGRWYLVNGELSSPEDQALEQFAALAAADDARLVALSRGAPDSTEP